MSFVVISLLFQHRFDVIVGLCSAWNTFARLEMRHNCMRRTQLGTIEGRIDSIEVGFADWIDSRCRSDSSHSTTSAMAARNHRVITEFPPPGDRYKFAQLSWLLRLCDENYVPESQRHDHYRVTYGTRDILLIPRVSRYQSFSSR